MNRRQWGWMVALFMLTLLATVSAPAFPAEGVPPQAPATAPAATPAGSDADVAREQAVEQILLEQEKLMEGRTFSYDPSGRRDPFRSLYESTTLDQAKRPRGIAGMLVTELDLTGIVKDGRGGDVAMVTGTDSKGYFLRVGDAVFDGTVIAVDSRLGRVTFRQQVDDPRLIKPYRDIVKTLVPLEESAND